MGAWFTGCPPVGTPAVSWVLGLPVGTPVGTSAVGWVLGLPVGIPVGTPAVGWVLGLPVGTPVGTPGTADWLLGLPVDTPLGLQTVDVGNLFDIPLDWLTLVHRLCVTTTVGDKEFG